MGDHHPRARPAAGDLRPPEPPLDPLEFLSRSWSASAVDVPRPRPPSPAPLLAAPIAEDPACCELDDGAATAGSSFSFASAATSQFIMERILAQSEVAPLTTGRLSHSSGPLNGGGSLTDSPPVSPEIDDSQVHFLSPLLLSTR
uniref:VAN3-binding protein-like auxin canalisation domain-containing protein n=2 Tax=Triticum urartu TaxID=4572 RepID=A0A8R7QIL8_TRIUA